MSADAQPRIALLIDADNAPASKIQAILDELSKYGVINVRRAYGNWKKPELKAWEERLHEFAIRPMQQFDYSKGKNASDMAMVIDAMELLYTDKPQAFGLVSSDADFTPLVMHLKSKGAVVFGFGQKKAPEPFQRACSTFLFVESIGSQAMATTDVAASTAAIMEDIVAADAAQLQPMPTSKLKMDTRLVNLLRGAVQAVAEEDGWALLGLVGCHIANQASFDPRNYGYEKLGALFEATQLFEIKRVTTQMYVRDMLRAKRKSSQKPVHAPVAAPQPPAEVEEVGGIKTPRSAYESVAADLHVERAALWQDIYEKATVADVLQCVPELAQSRNRYTLDSVGGRLRADGLLSPPHSAVKILGRFPDSFEIALQAIPAWVRYCG